MNHEKIEFNKARDFGGLLNVTFEYMRQNFKVLFKSNLFIGGPTILVAGIFLGLYQSSLFSFDINSTLPQMGLPFLLYALFSMISYFTIMVVTYSHLMVYKKSGSELFDVENVWQETKNNFWMLAFTAIGYAFILGLMGLILIGLGFYLVFEGYYFFILIAFLGIGLVVYFSINYSLIFIVRLVEGVGFSDALKRSKELISGKWWFTFGLIFVVTILQSFMMYALYIPTYIVMFFAAFAAIDSELGIFSKALFIITSSIISLGALLYSISTVVISFHYYNLIERKEAPGLLQQIDSIK